MRAPLAAEPPGSGAEAEPQHQSDTASNIIQAMSKSAKLLAAMAANPRDWTIDQVETVARG
jgi:hypothetical protein